MSSDSPELEEFEADAFNFLFGGEIRTVVEFLNYATKFITAQDNWEETGEDGFDGLTLHRAESLQIDDKQSEASVIDAQTKQGWKCKNCAHFNALFDQKCCKCVELRPADSLKIQLRRSRSYDVITKDKLSTLQEALISKLSRECTITTSAASSLLRQCKWDQQEFAQIWSVREKKTELLESTGLTDSLTRSFVSHSGDPEADYACEICYSDVPTKKTFALSCTHRFCIECWRGFLQSEMKSGATAGGNALESRCPGFKCKTRVPEETYEMLLDPQDYSFYKKMLLNSFVDDNPKAVWCPRPGCDKVIMGSNRRSTVECSCGHQFCFSCLTDAHAPTSCEEAEIWRGKDQGSQSLDAKFLLEQTKACPQCGVRTKKEGGCMYIVCTSCKKPWCWQCGKSDHHVWECTRPVYGGANSGKADKDDMERYLFYYERYFNHQQSIKFSMDQRVKVQEKIQSLLEGEVDMTAADADFLAQAVELVIESRRVLSWTYAKIFTMKVDGPARDLFEYQQQELEKFTEKLNQFTEGDTAKLKLPATRKDVIDNTSLLNKFLTNIEGGKGVSSVISAASPSAEITSGISHSSISGKSSSRSSTPNKNESGSNVGKKRKSAARPGGR
eukprot:gb/GEZN01003005.1/.p1 GENE.gb/GEZN01003005.1/~~gb/GEZN01003005.1/.p1  ORF type:complete len:676 (+),score=107.22 gb/GEZN01003005.1/:183-2030(+)